MSTIDPSNQQMWNVYTELPEDEFRFQITYGGPEPESRSFSTAGADELLQQIKIFIGARIVRKWKEKQIPPQTMRVTVKLDFSPDEDLVVRVADDINAAWAEFCAERGIDPDSLGKPEEKP